MQLRKVWLNINGVNRMVVCDPEKDFLADVLRRIGLTGTKIGCNSGQCGACSVIVDNKLVRSCIVKMKNVAEYAKVTTIEGIGSPHQLHPLQQAWITFGGVQCGFCTPGFIVSAKALLDINPSPSRQEVRHWFQQQRNLCRCTGYKPLIDAVMAAAAVMRCEQGPETLEFHMPEDGSIYNTRYPKPTALEKVTGLCDFGDDIGLKMPDETLHLALVQPEIGHANIIDIDYSIAVEMPGVVKIITADDITGPNITGTPVTNIRSSTNGKIQPFICDKKVFRHGDVLAVVAAHTREQARAAAKMVKLNLQPLPEYPTALQALAPDAIRIHEETPNLFVKYPVKKGEDTRLVFEQAAYVVEGSFFSSRQPHLSIEPDTNQAYIDEEGRLTIQCKSQGIHETQKRIANGLGLPVDKVRIIENPTGATFGYGMSPVLPGITGACALATGKPVTLTLSYAEHMRSTGKRTPSYTNAKLACDKDGQITGLEFDILIDHGAYTNTGQNLMIKVSRFIGYPYDIPNVMGVCRGAMSNHDFGTTFRGYGSPQCYTASEALIDMMAEKIGMDPFEFRYKNIARPGALTNNGYPYLEYPVEQMMDQLRPIYQQALARAKAADDPVKKRGIGVICSGYSVSKLKDTAEIELELNADGTITHYNSWEQQGQGADIGTLVHTHEALRPLGITPEMIRLVQNDTAITPVTGSASGSRSHYMAGNATLDAARQLMDAMRKPDGSFRTYAQMQAEGIPTRYTGRSTTAGRGIPIDVNNGQGDPFPAGNYMCAVAEVEVDISTGKTTVLAVHSVADVGVIGNKLAIEGQAYGAISHSIGYALSENFQDIKKHSTMRGAGIPYCEDVPDELNYSFIENPRADGPHGSCGASEVFQSAGHTAIINAINNAVGVRIFDLPATAEKVKAALTAKANGAQQAEKYQFDVDFYQDFDYMIMHPVELNK